MFNVDLNRREKYLLGVLVVLLLLMLISGRPESVGVTVALGAAWAALIMFFVAIGVMLFVDPYK